MARTTNEKVNTHLQAALASLEKEKAGIDAQIRAIRSVLGQGASAVSAKGTAAGDEDDARAAAPTARKKRRRRKLSAEARARIAAAQKKRWAEFHKKQNN